MRYDSETTERSDIVVRFRRAETGYIEREMGVRKISKPNRG